MTDHQEPISLNVFGINFKIYFKQNKWDRVKILTGHSWFVHSWWALKLEIQDPKMSLRTSTVISFQFNLSLCCPAASVQESGHGWRLGHDFEEELLQRPHAENQQRRQRQRDVLSTQWLVSPSLFFQLRILAQLLEEFDLAPCVQCF